MLLPSTIDYLPSTKNMNLTFIRYKERYLLLILDFLAFFTAHCVTFTFRFKTGLFDNSNVGWPILTPALVTSIYWMLLSAVLGQYRPLYGLSRLDSLWNTIKTTTLGILLIYIILTLDNEPLISKGKVTLLVYWAQLILFAGGARIVLRTVQHHLIMRGIALSPAIIVGFNERGKDLLNQIRRHKNMGFNVMGFVDENSTAADYQGVPVLGKVDDLAVLIEKYGILEVILALRKDQEELMERVIGFAGQFKVKMKIMPEIQQVIYGQVRTQGAPGMPLIEVFPQLAKPWEMQLKRLMDIIISAVVLTLNIPVIIITAIAVKLDSPGPIIYSQKRVGKGGKEFTIYKFRSMVQDAEKHTGAKWAEKNDPRVTKVGRFLRVSRIDEIPQFFNVLIGNMSLVGPRPERKHFVEQFVKQIPLYARRHNVKPGITGFGQLRGKYDADLDDVKTRLSLDMQYINNISLGLDIRILFQTIFLVLRETGQ